MTPLTKILSSLSQGSTDSVQSGQSFGELDRYLHIQRSHIENALCSRMDDIISQGGGIILLVGSAGDGKSHLISSVRNIDKYKDTFRFYNDATESYSPSRTAIDTLREVLEDFSDTNIDNTSAKLVLAINIGKLNAFIEDTSVKTQYSKLVEFTHPLFSEDSNKIKETSRMRIVQFMNLQIFEFNKEDSGSYPVDSYFFKEFLLRITRPDISNPFYKAYKESIPLDASRTDTVVLNYQLLCLEAVQTTIINCLIEAIIRFRLMVTPRDFQDFIYSILVYEDLENYTDDKHFLEALLPSMLYNGRRSKIQRSISMLDPLKYSNTEHDEQLAALFTSPEIPQNYLDEELITSTSPLLVGKIRAMCNNNRKNIMRTTQFLFRLKHLLSYHSESREYIDFLNSIRGFFNENGQEVQRVYQMVSTVIPRHYGSYYSPEKTVPLNIQGSHHRLFAGIQLVPDSYSSIYESSNEFALTMTLRWRVFSEIVPLRIDYQLFEYLTCLNNGRLSLNFESTRNMAFSHFVRRLVSLSNSSDEVIVMTSENRKYILSKQFGVINYREC